MNKVLLTATHKWMHYVKPLVWFSDCLNWILLFQSLCLIMHEHLICTFVSGCLIKISMSSVSCGSIDGSNIPQSLQYDSFPQLKYKNIQASVCVCVCAYSTRLHSQKILYTPSVSHIRLQMHINTDTEIKTRAPKMPKDDAGRDDIIKAK